MPFEEDDHDSSIWFLDHSYMENMYRMFKKVNGKRGQPTLTVSKQAVPVNDAACHDLISAPSTAHQRQLHRKANRHHTSCACSRPSTHTRPTVTSLRST